MTQMTFTYDELLQALTAYEAEAIELYPQKKRLIQMTVLLMQDLMKSKHTASFRDDQKQSSLPGLLQVPMSLVNGPPFVVWIFLNGLCHLFKKSLSFK